MERNATGRIGVVGPLRHGQYRRLSETANQLVELDDAYTRLRLVKSTEEMERLAVAARLSDAAMQAVAEGVEPGMDGVQTGELGTDTAEGWQSLHGFPPGMARIGD